MSTHDRVSRREVLRMSLVAGVFASTGVGTAIAQALRRTPAQVLGPFYPVVKPLDQDADLTVVAGKTGRAAGQVIHVMGRVINRQGQPVKGARLEIWQANAQGRYTHPSDSNRAPLDPNFQGYAALVTDTEGRYRFKTIKPGAYLGDSGAMRAPHIHFDVRGEVNRIVTQMYFAGESWNDSDRFLATAGVNRERLIVQLRPASEGLEPDSMVGAWDIVLDEG
jgi:protocatechuate 3,4-dioxygenase, beta subunit